MPVQQQRRRPPVRKPARRPAKKHMGRILFLSLFLGILTAVACLAVVAVLLQLKTVPDIFWQVSAWCCAAVGGLFCGFAATMMVGRKGLFCGIFSGFLMFLVLFLVGAASSFSFQFQGSTGIMLLCCVLSSAVGGVVAVNIMPKSRRQPVQPNPPVRRRQYY